MISFVFHIKLTGVSHLAIIQITAPLPHQEAFVHESAFRCHACGRVIGFLGEKTGWRGQIGGMIVRNLQAPGLLTAFGVLWMAD